MSQQLSYQEPLGYLLTYLFPAAVSAGVDAAFPPCPRCLFLCPGQVLCFAYSSVWSNELIPLKTKIHSPPPSPFFWLSADPIPDVLCCAITQRAVPASAGWGARSGPLLLVAVTPAGLTAKLEHRQTRTTT